MHGRLTTSVVVTKCSHYREPHDGDKQEPAAVSQLVPKHERRARWWL
jgi:hypothetical protein